jgi:hypothetical protein
MRYVEIVAGHFEKTLVYFADKRFCFVHLDCDLRCCLDFFYPRVVPGGIILLDEYDDPAWSGCNVAVDEFLPGKPEKLEEISRDNHLKYFIRKQ